MFWMLGGIDSMNDAALLSVLNKLLSYDPTTGMFTYLQANKRRAVGSMVGTLRDDGYYEVTINYNRYRLHRLAWLLSYGYMPKNHIDHINGNRNDNRIANLREATVSENLQNQKKATIRNKLGVLGVSYKKGAYEPKIKVKGKNLYLGRFQSIEEASEAYLKAKRLHHSYNTL
jgi:hypothetical protein